MSIAAETGGQPDVGREGLWNVRGVARFLSRSERWVWRALKNSEAEIGSIPCYRLPGGAPRFDPEEIREWVRGGCPPARDFARRRAAARGRERIGGV